jgi:hypothetical protein
MSGEEEEEARGGGNVREVEVWLLKICIMNVELIRIMSNDIEWKNRYAFTPNGDESRMTFTHTQYF